MRFLRSFRSAVPLGAVIMLCCAAFSGTTAALQESDAERRFYEAELLWIDGDSAGAASSFAAIVEQFPKSTHPMTVWRAAARVRLGEIDLRSGRVDAAASAFVKAIEDEPISPWTSRAQVGLAQVLQRRQEREAVVELLESVVAAAEVDEEAVDLEAAAVARRRLGLIHRVWVRPAGGLNPWQTSGRVPIGGEPLDRPIAVAASADGTLVITDEGADVVVIVNPQDPDSLTRVIEEDARRPWWDLEGQPYVAIKGGVLMPREEVRAQFPDPERPDRALEDIVAGARGLAGEWILVSARNKSVANISASGSSLARLALVGTDPEPVDLASDSYGWLYVIDRDSRGVHRFRPDGTYEGGLASVEWEEPYALDVDALGNLYVLDRRTKKIDVFDAEGVSRWSLGPFLPGGVELRDPRDVAVDGQGRVYVADRGHSVVVMIQ
jgi:DNA-binding beta-propeller fold protein YncE